MSKQISLTTDEIGNLEYLLAKAIANGTAPIATYQKILSKLHKTGIKEYW